MTDIVGVGSVSWATIGIVWAVGVVVSGGLLSVATGAGWISSEDEELNPLPFYCLVWPFVLVVVACFPLYHLATVPYRIGRRIRQRREAREQLAAAVEQLIQDEVLP